MRSGYNVIVTVNGREAWEIIKEKQSPQIVVLDWMMPELDGIEVIRRIRKHITNRYIYTLLLTTKTQQAEIVEGLDAGADDYLLKPVNKKELIARLRVGVRIVQLETRLNNRVNQLQEALAEVKQLKGMLPICSYCKKIRDDRQYWTSVEQYVGQHTGAQFSHSICPDCFKKYVEPEFDELESDSKSIQDDE